MFTTDPATEEKFGSGVSIDELPISQDRRDEMDPLVPWYSEMIGWRGPMTDERWAEQLRFNDVASPLFERLCDELGPTRDMRRSF